MLPEPIRKARTRLRHARQRMTRVRRRAQVDNVYHCCVHKSASQWMRQVFADRDVYRYSGLVPYHYQSQLPGRVDRRPVNQRSITKAMPTGRIVTPIYIDYANFDGIPKPDRWRAFYVTRDPRDMVVSWYFSSRNTHPGDSEIPRHREQLRSMSQEDGLLYSIDRVIEFGHFDAMRSWTAAAPKADDRVRVFRFEELTDPERPEVLAAMFEHCAIDLPEHVPAALHERYGFQRMTGRARGTADPNSHMRSGKPGDWQTYFTPRVAEHFAAATGTLLADLGYEREPALTR